MERLQKKISIPTIVPVLLLCGLLGYQTFATRPVEPAAGPGNPAVVATVDLERLFSGLNLAEAENARLEAEARKIDEELERRRGELTQIEEEMKLVEEGSEREAELLEEYSHKGLQLQAHVEFERQRIDREKGLIMKGIYRDIKEAVKKVASDGNRYDIVMLNDSVKEITASGEGQVLQAISQRRMLYTNPMLDITDEVMSFMNNEFNAGG